MVGGGSKVAHLVVTTTGFTFAFDIFSISRLSTHCCTPLPWKKQLRIGVPFWIKALINYYNEAAHCLANWPNQHMRLKPWIHDRWRYIITCNFFLAEASPSAEMLSSLIACLMSISISVVIWSSGTLTPLFNMDFSIAETSESEN